MKADIFNCVALAAILFLVSVSSPSIATMTCRDEASTTGPPSDWSAHPLIYTSPAATAAPTGLAPAKIRAAYNLPSTGGNGTIAIVDAYDDPTVLNDLNVFSVHFNLPLLNSSNFEKHMMAPGTVVSSGWAVEISLDVEWAHAIAPNAKILLVEANSNSFSSLLAAVDYARSRTDVVAISMSWGGNEFSTESSYDSHFSSSYGAVFFASSGDNGAGVSWPASSPSVVAVGGTFLNFTAGGSVASETAWSGSGGGISMYEAEPSYQVAYNIIGANRSRCVPDVSYDADPRSGVAVYDSALANQSGWWQVGGTSAGAPQWAAIQSLGLSSSNGNFYQDASSANYSSYFRDITAGSNGAYTATAGYDCVTGLGSPLTTNYLPVATPTFSLQASPANLTVKAGNSINSTVTATSIKVFNGTVSLATSAPTGFNVSVLSPSLTIALGGSNSSTLSVQVLSSTQAGTYTIAVTGTSGSLSRTTTITVNVQTVPSAPQGLLAASGNSQVTLSWSAPSSNGGFPVTGYTIYRGISSGNETLLVNAGNRLNYTDTAAANGKTYYYQVTASNPIGESQKSNESYATPQGAKAISVTVTTNKTTCPRGSSIVIIITVKDNATGNALRGATVNVTAYNPNGSVAWKSLGPITTSNGTFPLTYTPGKNSPVGTYNIVVTVTYAGYQTGTGQATFSVS
jgi:subtilase family serine protease